MHLPNSKATFLCTLFLFSSSLLVVFSFSFSFCRSNMFTSKLAVVYSIIFILLSYASNRVVCHTKGIRPKKGESGKLLSVNMTQVQYSEQQFMKWVQFVGSLKHSAFKTAKNKLFPSYTLTVDKNPNYGDFTTIQEAIDSLPPVNLVRVLIKVHAGVYT